MARPRTEIRGEVQQAVKDYIDCLICEGTAPGTGCAVDRNQLKPCKDQRRPIESRAARIPDYMKCAGCAPAGYSYPPSQPRRHHWIEFRPNGSPEPPRVPSPPPPRSCGYYCPRESMLADCVKPICPEKTFNRNNC